MKKVGLVVAALVASLSLAACNSPRERAAARGGLLGATAGALVGAAVTGRASGAVAGAAIGGAGGAIAGAASAPRRRCARVRYDYDGNRVCTRYYYN